MVRGGGIITAKSVGVVFVLSVHSSSHNVYGHPNVAVAANLMHRINQIGDGIFIIEDGGIWSYEPPPPYTTIEKEWGVIIAIIANYNKYKKCTGERHT